MSADIERMALAYADARASRAPHRPAAGALEPSSLEQAYAVQRRLVEIWRDGARGAIGGYKIALTSSAMQQMVGVDQPCGGVIFAADIRRTPAHLALSDFQHLGLEFELCFQLARPLPPRDVPYDAASVRDAVAGALPAFELIDDRNADYAVLDAKDLVADNAWCAGIVLGTAHDDWRELDLSNTAVTLEFNGVTERASTGAALGNPLTALAWVANHQCAQGAPLEAGHWVMTGSTMKTRFPAPGDSARFSVQGLGSVEVSLRD